GPEPAGTMKPPVFQREGCASHESAAERATRRTLPDAVAAWFGELRRTWQGYCDRQHRELVRLRRLYWEGERLRAELSHLEREILGVRRSSLPRRQRELLESALRVRLRKVEIEMLTRQNE